MLEGIRVLEVSHAVAGPTASQVLADYGAEVVKIERPGKGDIFRNTPGMGPSMFLAVNRGKKSVAIDLKKPLGLKLFYLLAKASDVIIENLGPGAAEGLGITYRKIRKANPRAIYCRVESFGKGPYQNVPAFDPVLQAAVGMMSTTGFPPHRYVRAGVSVVDMSAGLHAATGILSLLLRRNKTGEGGELEVSLYDAASYFMSYWITLFDLYGIDTKPLGSTHVFGAPYNLFKTKDGYVYIAIASDKAWESFCSSLGFDDLSSSRRFVTNERRVRQKRNIESLVARRIKKFRTAEITRSLRGTGVPFAKLNTVRSLLKDNHFLQRGSLIEYAYSSAEEGRAGKSKSFRTVVNPSIIDGLRPYAKRSPPILGSDTRSVLKSILHLSDKQLNDLERDDVISPSS